MGSLIRELRYALRQFAGARVFTTTAILTLALGAGRPAVVRLVLQGAFRRVAVGLALGLPLAVGAGYLLSAQLYGVRFWDPLALAAGAISLAVCAFIAAVIPARRAATIAPNRALRTD